MARPATHARPGGAARPTRLNAPLSGLAGRAMLPLACALALLLVNVAPLRAVTPGPAPGRAAVSAQPPTDTAARATSPPAGQAEPGAVTFRVAEGRRAWAFPRDHGQHPDFRLEWWYYTGNLIAESGERFGFQVTFFRSGVAPRQRRPSAWAVRSLYLAHAAVSDIGAARHLRAATVGRDSLAMSGASTERHEVWLNSWRAVPLAGDPHGVRLRIAAEAFSLDLTLRSGKPPVLHGEGGLDRKGGRPRQASWYYSLPRMETAGTLEVGGRRFAVRGTSWMDHEFGSGQLGDDQVGWDWFAIRLDDGRDLMLYRLRRADGTTEPLSGGSLIAPGGGRAPLRIGGEGSGAVQLMPGKRWRSPVSGADYPVRWRIAIPGEQLVLEVTPAFESQEMAPQRGIPIPYWEGAITVQGSAAGRAVQGEGYMELTGYAGRLGRYFR